MSDEGQRHGTLNSYIKRKCRCDECSEVASTYFRAYRKSKRSAPIPETAHGTLNGYRLYRCRCDACRERNARYARAYRDRKRAEAEQ